MVNKLSNENIEELINLRKNGVTINELSTKFNISIATVYKYLQRNNEVNCYREKRVELNNKILQFHNEGYSNIKIGKILGMSRSSVARILHKLGVPRRNNIKEDIIKRNKEIVDLYETGEYTQQEIADKFGMHRTSINTIISMELGISHDKNLLMRDKKIKELISQGKTAKEISDELYISQRMLSDNYNKKDKIKHVSEIRENIKIRNKKIVELYNSGKYSQTELGVLFDLTQASISNIIKNNKERIEVKDVHTN